MTLVVLGWLSLMFIIFWCSLMMFIAWRGRFEGTDRGDYIFWTIIIGGMSGAIATGLDAYFS